MSKRVVPRVLREQWLPVLLAEQGHKCPYCGEPLADDGKGVHIDHVLALSKGGTDERDNLQATCAGCNLSKASGDKPKPKHLRWQQPPNRVRISVDMDRGRLREFRRIAQEYHGRTAKAQAEIVLNEWSAREQKRRDREATS